MEHLPLFVYATFIATVAVAYFLIGKASQFKKPFMIATATWIVLQSVIALTGFYTHVDAVPPRFPLLVLPPFFLLIYNLTTTKGKQFLHSLDIKTLTIFHTIRIPVEVVLYWLYQHKAIPMLMTFEGSNFDILSGLSAPIVYYLAFVKKTIGRTTLLAWNIICLLLVINVVVRSILASPTPFQQLAFDQPNIGVLYFPFVLLPSFLVPMVMLSHISAITQFIRQKKIDKRLALSAILALLIVFKAPAQSHLDSYISMGLANNLSIQQQNFELSKAMYALKEAKTLYYPNVAFNSTYTLAEGGRVIDLPLGNLLNGAYSTLNQLTASNNFPKLENQSIQLNPNNFYDVKLRTTYPIFNADIKYNYRIKESEVGLQKLAIDQYKRELVKDIKAAYYQYVQSLKAIDIYQNAQQLVQENYRINTSLFNNQKVNRTALLRSEYEVKKIENALIDANKNSENAKAYFNFLLNRSLKDSILTDAFSSSLPVSVDAIADVSNREELGKLSKAQDIHRNLIMLNSTYHLPKVSAMLDGGAQNFDFVINKHTPYMLLGLSVDWNLFSAGRNKYKEKAAEASLSSINKQTEFVKSQLDLQLSTASNSFHAAVKVYGNTAFQEKAALRNYTDLLKLYKEGQVIYIELLDAQTQYINAQLQTSIALMDTWIKYTEVERANASFHLK